MTDFSYNDGVPATNDNPSVDQPDMLINTQSVLGIIAVDHVGFNALNGGQHKAIEFNQDASYVPTPPVSPPQLFTNAVATLPQLFYYSGSAAQSSMQYNQAANFSTFLLGGLILKGGQITVISTPQTFTYSALTPALAAFPNATLAVYLQPTTSTPIGTEAVTGVTSTGFTLTRTSSVAFGSFYFLAIGY